MSDYASCQRCVRAWQNHRRISGMLRDQPRSLLLAAKYLSRVPAQTSSILDVRRVSLYANNALFPRVIPESTIVGTRDGIERIFNAADVAFSSEVSPRHRYTDLYKYPTTFQIRLKRGKINTFYQLLRFVYSNTKLEF